MLYIPSLNLAFYHIHKTGGTSFKTVFRTHFSPVLEVDPWPHYPLAYYLGKLESMGVDPASLMLLTTIRDPLHHVVSIYHYWRQLGNPARPNVQAAKKLSFKEFVAYYVSSRLPDCRVYNELLFVGGVLPENMHILRLESWREDLKRLGCALIPSEQFPRVRCSKHEDPATYHNADTIRQIRERYRWAYDAGFYPEPTNSPVSGRDGALAESAHEAET